MQRTHNGNDPYNARIPGRGGVTKLCAFDQRRADGRKLSPRSPFWTPGSDAMRTFGQTRLGEPSAQSRRLLLVIAYEANIVGDPRNEGHFLNRRLVRPRPGKHVIDFSEFSF